MTIIELIQTWTLVDLPPKCSRMMIEWLHKVKKDPKGTLIKYKAHLVIKGFEQQKCIDYLDIVAYVVGWTTICAMVAIVIQQN
jgi:hypothetical protein